MVLTMFLCNGGSFNILVNLRRKENGLSCFCLMSLAYMVPMHDLFGH